MVYKIGNVADLWILSLIDDTALELLYHYARVLTDEYGENRNIDTDDGGFLLYAPSGTPTEEIKACFDYMKHCVESVDRFGDLLAATYILHNEFAVTIILSAADAPTEILNEIDERNENK